jgi:hypothetical protein
MPNPAYIPLAHFTVATAAPSVSFITIPALYKDLVVVAQATGSTTLQGRIRLNNDSGTNYSFQRFSGSGSARTGATAVSQTSAFLSVIAQATTTGFLQMNINIMDYSATDKHKTILSRADQPANGTEMFVNRWANTAAITSVQILSSTGNWAVGSSFSLYGILA